jgi:hypothetical protein
MAYNINLDPTQSFSPSTENELNTNDWVFDPPSPIIINYYAGASVPNAVDVDTTIRDYLGNDSTGLYSYHIRPNVTIANSSSNVMPLSLSGEIFTAFNSDPLNGYEILNNNLSVTTTVNFQNLSVLPVGTHIYNVIYTVFKKDAVGNFILTGFKIIVVRLNVLTPETLLIQPENINISHIIDDALPASQNINIVAPSAFTLTLNQIYTLSGGNLVAGSVSGGIRTYTGSGSQTITLELNSNVNALDAASYIDLITFSDSNSQITAAINLYLFEENSILVQPQVLEFVAIKNILEAEPKPLSVQGIGSISLSGPSWLNIANNIGNYNIDTIITPALSQNLSIAVYESVIEIQANGISIEIPVKYTIYDSVVLGLSEEAVNYTDDFDGISTFYTTPEFKLKLAMTVKHYAYGFPTEFTKDLNYKLGVFNNKTQFFVGRSLNNIMAELQDLALVNMQTLANITFPDGEAYFRKYYRPAKVNLQVDFTHQNDDTLNQSFSFENIEFIKGRKPLQSFDKTAILNYYLEPLRVTPKSIAFFNFFQTGNHIIRIFKNGELLEIRSHNIGEDKIWCYKYTFQNFVPGDVVEIRLYKSGSEMSISGGDSEYISQTYIVIPEGKRSYHIGWENENGVIDLMEFTGDISFKMAYDNNIVNNYRDFKEFLRKIDTRRSQTVVVNTGFVLQQNPKRLDSLLSAKRAWIMSETDEAVFMVPATKELANYDSDQELYAYDVEFQINLNNDNKVNS